MKRSRESSDGQRRTNPFSGEPHTARYYDILSVTERLPASQFFPDFLRAWEASDVIVLVGETGSGKTTQLPKRLLMTKPESSIVCTQPRRLAATSVAVRVSEEMDVRPGSVVGYSVRFEERKSSDTRLLFATEGILLRTAMTDPSFASLSTVFVDEAHERTINTDFLLGLLKNALREREEGSFKVVVMSATLAVDSFVKFFGEFRVATVNVPGTLFETTIHYEPTDPRDYVGAVVNRVSEIHKSGGQGDILAFLPGEEDIRAACGKAARDLGNAAVVLPLFGQLPLAEQQKVFEGYAPRRKVVFTTNIAETSLTIDGIVHVVDCGFVKQTVYDAQRHVTYFNRMRISKAAAGQRRGRAGRTRNGHCHRMYTESTFAEMDADTFPEVLRSDLCPTVLTMLRLGITDVVRFDFLTPPSAVALSESLLQLQMLQALDDDGILTGLGKRMSTMPLHPMYARMVLDSHRFGCVLDMCAVVGLLTSPSVFLRPTDHMLKREAARAKQRFTVGDSDHITLLSIFRAWKRAENGRDWCAEHFFNNRSLEYADKVRRQLLAAVQHGTDDDLSQSWLELGDIRLRKAILNGLFARSAFLPQPSPDPSPLFTVVNSSSSVRIHPSSVVHSSAPSLIVFDQVEETESHVGTARVVTAVCDEWAVDVAPQLFDAGELEGIMQRRVLNVLRKRRNGTEVTEADPASATNNTINSSTPTPANTVGAPPAAHAHHVAHVDTATVEAWTKYYEQLAEYNARVQAYNNANK